jgi:hypothetical protein
LRARTDQTTANATNISPGAVADLTVPPIGTELAGNPTRRWLTFVAAALVLALCGGLAIYHIVSGSRQADTVQPIRTHVTAAKGGTVSVAGVTLRLPPGALDHDTDVRLQVGAQPPSERPPLFAAAGPAVHGDLGGAHLSQSATLRLPLSQGVSTANAGYLDDTSHEWVPLTTTAETASRTLVVSIQHMSWYQPLTWNLAAAKAQFEKYFGRLVGYAVPLRTDPPHCGAASRGVSAIVTGGRSGDPSLDGCVETASAGQIRLRLVNNRPYGIALTPPTGSRQETVSRGGLLEALYQNKALTDVGGDFIPAGGSADYVMPGSGPTVSAVASWSWKTYSLDSAVGLILTLAGKGETPTDASAAASATTGATRLSTAELASVGKCLGDKLAADPPDNVRDAIAGNIACLGELNDFWLAPLALLQDLISAIAGALDAGQDLAVGAAGKVSVIRPISPSQTPERSTSSRITVPATTDPLAAGVMITGMRVVAGQTMRFAATGRARYGYEGAADCVGEPQTDPDGRRSLPTGSCLPKSDANAPVPAAPIGALIARIGAGPWFLAGRSGLVRAIATGAIFLGFNDEYAPDDAGAYVATVTIGP